MTGAERHLLVAIGRAVAYFSERGRKDRPKALQVRAQLLSAVYDVQRQQPMGLLPNLDYRPTDPGPLPPLYHLAWEWADAHSTASLAEAVVEGYRIARCESMSEQSGVEDVS